MGNVRNSHPLTIGDFLNVFATLLYLFSTTFVVRVMVCGICPFSYRKCIVFYVTDERNNRHDAMGMEEIIIIYKNNLFI